MKDDSLSDVDQKKIAAYHKAVIDSVTVKEGVFGDSVGKQGNVFSPNEETNVYAKQIWNDALEAAADVSEINSAANIRKLKK